MTGGHGNCGTAASRAYLSRPTQMCKRTAEGDARAGQSDVVARPARVLPRRAVSAR
jgi:hypothetical protein